jgi:tetratricopeptide (TPR) repeat protein
MSLNVRHLPPLTFSVILVVTAVVLWPALNGDFLFDDYVNLKTLGSRVSVHDWFTFKAFVIQGLGGPTGRPVALVSFLLNDNTWPSQAYSFKYTNLMLHLLTGCVLTWSSLLLCRFYGLSETKAQYFALFNAAAWLLHPYLVSTTFYIIQRMAQLATLFCLAGIAAYLHGRMLTATRPRAGYLWMIGGVGLGTLLATFSKENGALLPLLILLIEFCRPKGLPPAKFWFRAIFIYAPTIVILGLLASYIDLSAHPWDQRPFNQAERLLTEARILWDYLGNLFIPRIESAGLYRDGFAISRGPLQPLSTLPALLGIAGLVVVALRIRRRLPLVSLAVLFFFGAHLLESTVIGLELYFEHRNYLPAAFLFLPVAQGLSALPHRFSPALKAGLALFILVVLGLLAHQRALLWSKPAELDLYWALSAPNSPRAQNSLVAHLQSQGNIQGAREVLLEARDRFPDSPLLTLRTLLFKLETNTAHSEDFTETAYRLIRQPMDAQAIAGLRRLVNIVTHDPAATIAQNQTLRLIERLAKESKSAHSHFVWRLLPYLKAQIYLAQKRYAPAETQYRIAINRFNEVDATMQMVAEMATAGQTQRALHLLDAAQDLLSRQEDRALRYPRAYYRKEIGRLRDTLQAEARHSAPIRLDTGAEN